MIPVSSAQCGSHILNLEKEEERESECVGREMGLIIANLVDIKTETSASLSHHLKVKNRHTCKSGIEKRFHQYSCKTLLSYANMVLHILYMSCITYQSLHVFHKELSVILALFRVLHFT